ncbi:uncharacterized protein LOC125759104 [Rhipicephalus sanguineus]|uniref:uncharacterized protein LOC125759104 n=1 Tax=Rhipicephalus sanguineus TaxID=34632 RepID=UPI0020C4E052|nr:uncharacterized protein LOC125759104 [Rhipicephalus sanguineus]
MKVWEVLQAQHNKTEHVELLGVIQLIASWFGEDLSELVQKRDACLTPTEIEELGDVPLSPCIIAAGDDLWNPEEYLVLVDHHVLGASGDFTTAFCMLFASYFCFHVCYAEGVESTLEFIQRALFGINPDHGSKGNKKTKKVNRKVLSLTKKIMECEWNV